MVELLNEKSTRHVAELLNEKIYQTRSMKMPYSRYGLTVPNVEELRSRRTGGTVDIIFLLSRSLINQANPSHRFLRVTYSG